MTQPPPTSGRQAALLLAGLTALTTLAALTPSPAHAGRSCESAKPPQARVVERGLNLAQRTAEALDASGQRVVFLARAGQDLSKYGVTYSHLGIAYQQAQTNPDGKPGHVWRVLHKLNQCGTADAFVYSQGLGEFFLDDLWRYEAAWVVPTPDMQDRLLPLLTASAVGSRALSMNSNPYSIVGYAWGLKYQQSNQWAIETLAAALSPPVATRAQAQAWLQTNGYVPTTLKLGPLTRLGGRVSAANVAFDDHPSDKRFTDRIETVTVDSVFQWLQRAGLGGAPTVIQLP